MIFYGTKERGAFGDFSIYNSVSFKRGRKLCFGALLRKHVFIFKLTFVLILKSNKYVNNIDKIRKISITLKI
jgi:hypothetical protein